MTLPDDPGSRSPSSDGDSSVDQGRQPSTATTFELSVNSAEILPFKPGTKSPWDWDGDIPDFLIDALEFLEMLTMSGTQYAEILKKVDEIAPQILEGTVPPDVFIRFQLVDNNVGETIGSYESATVDNTLRPVFEDARVEVSMDPSLTLWISFVDRDIAFDDLIQSFPLSLEDLQWLADGQWELNSEDPLAAVRSMNLDVKGLNGSPERPGEDTMERRCSAGDVNGCSGEQVCVGGSCEDAFPRWYNITLRSALVPSDNRGMGWDVLGGLPDPMAFLIQNGEVVGSTPTASDTVTPFWNEDFIIEMNAFDQLEVVVVDVDVAVDDDITSCDYGVLSAAQIRGGDLSCYGTGIELRVFIAPN